MQTEPFEPCFLKENLLISYKDLCTVLSEPVLTGRNRQLQLDRWKEFFEHKQIGQRLQILVLKKPLPLSEDGKPRLPQRKTERKERENIWRTNLILQILHHLSSFQTKDSPTDLTYRELGLTLNESLLSYGFCNSSLFTLSDCPIDQFQGEEDYITPKPLPRASTFKALIEEVKKTAPLDIDTTAYLSSPAERQKLLATIQSKIFEKGTDIISSSLEHLKKRKIITYRYSYCFTKTPFSTSPPILASPEEENLINFASLQLLTNPEYDCKTVGEVFAKKKHLQFFQARANLLRAMPTPFYRVKRCHILGFSPAHIHLAQAYILELEKLQSLREDLNLKSRNFFLKKPLSVEKNEAFVQRILDFVLPLESLAPRQEFSESEEVEEFFFQVSPLSKEEFELRKMA